MSPHEFVTAVGFICGLMAIAAVIEIAAPLFGRSRTYSGRHSANLALTAIILLLNWGLNSLGAVVALSMGMFTPSLMSRVGMPLAMQVVVSLVVLDFFFGYIAHRALHAFPTLWRVHRVHHSDAFVDVTTTYRNHPIESVWRFLCLLVPICALGVPAEALILYRFVSAINAIFEHANIKLWQPLDSALSLVWVTPNMHKVHHSRDRRETDSNYGNIFSVFDRGMSTFTPTDRALSVSYGLDDADPRHSTSLTSLLTMPMISATHQLGQSPESAAASS